MRYYNIVCGNGWSWSSHPNGQHDPNAQEVEMMIELYMTPDPTSNSTLEIHGVPWEQIRTTNTLIDQTIQIYGGMEKGLPLATFQSRNKGHLCTGRIQKAWGNWVGTNMSIGMQIVTAGLPSDSSGGGGGFLGGENIGPAAQTTAQAQMRYNRVGPRSIDSRPFAQGQVSVSTPGGSSIGGTNGATQLSSNFPNLIGGVLQNYIGGGIPGLTNPINLIHNLLPNMPLSSAIQQTLSTALPGLPLNIQISPMLKLGYQDAGVYQSLEQYIGYIHDLSQSILGATLSDKNYLGVRASSDGRSLDIWDETSNLGNTTVSPYDLIGQPTWIERYQVQIKTAMRGNIKPGMTVSLPTTLFNVEAGAIQLGTSEQRSNLTLGGSYLVNHVRHIGDFRNPDGNNWCTIMDCWPVDVLTSSQTIGEAAANTTPPASQNQPQTQTPVTQSQSLSRLSQSLSRLMTRAVRRY